MTKSQKTWTVLILGFVLIGIVVMLILKFWYIAIVGAAAFLVGFVFGYRQGKIKGPE